MHQGGGLIQEGADNININIETVDGKNTFHSVARAVFQIRHYAVDTNISQSKKKRSQERSIQISNSASSLTASLAFSKPKTRGVPGRIENAFDRITECSSNLSKTSDILRLLLRSISRKIVDIPIRFPANQPQQIPFWTGYNSGLSEYKSECSVVSYAPIIESKPNDMSTVFTTMKRYIDMTKAMVQVHSVHTFDQQLYAIAKPVEWKIPETFPNHTVRYPAILQRLESCGVMVVFKICWLILLYMLPGQLIRC
jgi:hypothetical protein